MPKPMILIVLDGWGFREDPRYNAIAAAHKPAWERLWTFPHTLIHASEGKVGLPTKQMGNSEVGHLNLGAGRVVYQEYTRINKAIEDRSFFANPAFTESIDAAVKNGRAVHLLGLLSPGGVHSHEEHFHAMAELAVARGAKKLYVHAFLDGRDTPPRSAADSIIALDTKLASLGVGRIASLCGRYFAMDRDKRWDRVQLAYDLLTKGEGEFSAPNAVAGLEAAYARGENDEFVKPTVITPAARIEDGDAVIFMNFRSDRARELTMAFTEPGFDGFVRKAVPKLSAYVTITEYNEQFKHVRVAFAPDRLNNMLGAYVAERGMNQLRIAETEKYAHVTFFFNGGVETPYRNEDRILVPSPKDVPTYDLKPEMSSAIVADKMIDAIKSGKYDMIVCNFANADMVGHTGNFDAAVKAIEAIDTALGRILEAAQSVGGEILITADHGNAEEMYDPDTKQAHTAHTINLVPLIYVGRPAVMAPTGALEDIAPTMLNLMGVPIPKEMTGQVLVDLRRGTAVGAN